MDTVSTYRVGQLTKGTVQKILPYGIFLRMPDGTSAYIRRRQLSWNRDADPNHEVYIGQEIEAHVIALPSDKQVLELTRLQTLPNPWHEFLRRFRAGDAIQGRVADIVNHGIIVELLPGVYGLVPMRELALQPNEQIEDVYWVDDIVEALIEQIQASSQKIELSIRRYLEQRIRTSEFAESMNLLLNILPPAATEAETPLAVASDYQETEPPINSALLTGLGDVLIIEDHNEISTPLTSWLKRRGCTADSVATTEDALVKLQQHAYDWIIIDIDLPDMNGLAFAQRYRCEFAGAQIIVMSIAERLLRAEEEIAATNAITAFVKPLDTAEIERTLAKLACGESVAPFCTGTLGQPKPNVEPMTMDGFPQHFLRNSTMHDRLRQILLWLKEQTAAESIIIFEKDTISQTIDVVEEITVRPRQQGHNELDDSPVADLMQNGQVIFENAVSIGSTARFRKLLDFVSFESCIGVPVPVHHTRHYVLFLLCGQMNGFSPHDLQVAQVGAALVAAAVERDMFDEHVHSMDKLVLSGQLAASFGHEVFNKMSGLDIQVENLRQDIEIFTGQDGNGHEEIQPSVLRSAAAELSRIVVSLRSTVDLFRESLLVSETDSDTIREALQHARAILLPTAQQCGCQIVIDIPEPLSIDTTISVKLQQVFINVMLNALQHMHLSKTGLKKELTVSVMICEDDPQLPIKLRFADSGRGIHRRLWERIFRLGVSSRTDGTGIGLFVVRNFVNSAGGRVRVEQSVIHMGTTILIELPVVKSAAACEPGV
ncbi:MAG TPA: S1 RNA-binding domain-containing protein [Caldilineaceae bacterium]|nr:S1 RNA-binding domain-containing protein [Caldilineaceae bacterium]